MTTQTNAYGGVLIDASDLHYQDAIILRQNNGPEMARLAKERGWTMAQFAGYFNSQHGIGGTLTEQGAADLIAFHGGGTAPAPATLEDNFLQFGGKRYRLTLT